MTEITIQKTAPVVGSYDVVVCGGGPAGWAAAIAAARGGVKTAIVEKLGAFGGTATGGYVIPISGFFHKGKQVVHGIAWELVRRLEEMGAAQVEYPKGHVSVHVESYKLLAQRMLDECGVETYTHSLLTGCVRQGSRITHILIDSKNGTEAIEGRFFIDATGEADLCRRAGVPMMENDDSLQPMSLCFVLEGVDVTTPLLRDYIHHDGKDGRASCQKQIHAYLSECVAQGRLRQFGGPWFNSMVQGGALAVNVTRCAADASRREEVTRAEKQLREDMFTIVALLKEKYPEFAHCSIVASGVYPGVRETARIRGVGMARGEDFLAGVVPPHPVAYCAHPMDMHRPGSSEQQLISLERPGCVLHDALIPLGVDNLLAAGRCICADAQAYASLRVQATLMAIGEASGSSAASACRV